MLAVISIAGQDHQRQDADAGAMLGALYKGGDTERRGCMALSALPKIFAGCEDAGPLVAARHPCDPFQALQAAAVEGAAVGKTDHNRHISTQRL